MVASNNSDDLKTKVFGLDLEPIKFKLIKEHNWTLEKADEVEQPYKAFLYLAAKHPEQSLVPTRLVDEMWHTHILDTAKYAEDSQRLFGKFLHHWPYSGLLGADDLSLQIERRDTTSSLVKAEFGQHAWVDLLDPAAKPNRPWMSASDAACSTVPNPPISCVCQPTSITDEANQVMSSRPGREAVLFAAQATACGTVPNPPVACVCQPAAGQDALTERPGRGDVLTAANSVQLRRAAPSAKLDA